MIFSNTVCCPMLIIGENLHCSRVLKRGGTRCQATAGGGARIVWGGSAGAEQGFAVPPELAGDKVKHVAAAIRVAQNQAADAAAALAYLQDLARRQEQAGAHYLDLNTDEFSTDKACNAEALAWLVGQVAAWIRLPLSLDSSDVDVLRAGAAGLGTLSGHPLLFNSASLERPEVLDLAAAAGADVLLSAAGAATMPQTAAERVAALKPMVELASAKGIAPERMFLDPLVFPVAVDPAHGNGFINACRELRKRYGPAVHIVGGISNVSFGMPERRLLNYVFLKLAAANGLDAAIYDPHQLAPLPAWTPEWLAAATRVLTGDDPYGMDFLALVRAG
ncbi:MAG: dihydropteroate synthase [Lentisphaeria bacterium]